MRSSDQTVDAVVVGGGPAGAMAASHLARAGWSVVLAEKGDGARVKTCGYCLSPQAVRLLKHNGLRDEVDAIAAGPLRRIVLHSGTAGPTTLPLDRVPGLIVSRPALDQRLRNHAVRSGAELRIRTTARLLADRSTGARVELKTPDGVETLTAGLVVGADGLSSRIARSAGLRHRSRLPKAYGVACNLQAPARIHHRPEAGAIEMFVSHHGYLGMVRLDDSTVHVGALIRPTVRHCGPLATIDRFLEEFAVLRALPLDTLGPEDLTACGPLPCVPADVACGHIVLVGDAAGYVEPFTGQGIGWALESAEALRCAVEASTLPSVWTDDTATIFRNEWRTRLEDAHRVCARIGWGLSHTVARQAIVRVPSIFPPLGRFAARRVLS